VFLAATLHIHLTHNGFVSIELAPLVVVFTKYDILLRTKKAELRENNNDLNPADLDMRSKEEAQKEFDTCVQSLEKISRRMGIPMPRHARASSIVSPSSFGPVLIAP
jgi:hypothetical protein